MKITITGGAGFIGYHSCKYFAQQGHDVVLLDDFSRKGSQLHAEKLISEWGSKIKIIEADISNCQQLNIKLLDDVCGSSDVVLHLAAQVAVTTSVQDPRRDFEVNALGTLNLLEACRKSKTPPFFIYASTNKVYGELLNFGVVEKNGRYAYAQLPLGVSEETQLDFHSPYGCSKGAADQYVRDYSRIYGVPGVVLRQSCIYGTDQYGHEEQGWIAHISLNACRNLMVKIFGDGKQVRDVLFIDDLVGLYDLCIKNQNKVSGKIYNTGGGPKNVLSLLDLISILEKKLGRKIEKSFYDWRPGDQKVYVSNVAQLKHDLGWEPGTSPQEGIEKIIHWAESNQKSIETILSA